VSSDHAKDNNESTQVQNQLADSKDEKSSDPPNFGGNLLNKLTMTKKNIKRMLTNQGEA